MWGGEPGLPSLVGTEAQQTTQQGTERGELARSAAGVGRVRQYGLAGRRGRHCRRRHDGLKRPIRAGSEWIGSLAYEIPSGSGQMPG